MTKYKCTLIFLAVMNLINLAGGIITQVTMITNGDVVSIIPISFEMTVDQILLLNFMAVAIIISIISVVTTYLVVDAPYSFGEIISNCAGIFLVIPVLLIFAAVYNMINAPAVIDKISIIASAVVFLLLNVVNFGCVLTVKEDDEL